MGILTNGFRDRSGVYQTFGATASNNAYPGAHHANFHRAGANRNLTAGQGITSELVGLPSGARHPAAWMMPQKAGALAARNTVVGLGATSATGQSGYNIDGTLTGAGDIPNSVSIGLIVSIAAALTASGDISSAATEALAAMVAELTGAGSVTATAAGLAELGAAIAGTGFVTANNTALMSIAATIRGYGDLTPEGIRDVVWAKIVEAGFSAEEIMRLLAAHAAGSATGLESGNPQFTGLDGSTLRIDGSYAGGTRTIDSLNGS